MSYIVLGEAYYAKLREDNKDTNYDEEGIFSLALIPRDEEQEQKLKTLGLGHLLNDASEKIPGTYINIKLKKAYQNKEGETKYNPAPSVLDKEGQPFTANIGNGSLVAVQIKTYKAGKTKKTYAQLEALKVLNLIPYGEEGGETLDNFSLPEEMVDGETLVSSDE